MTEPPSFEEAMRAHRRSVAVKIVLALLGLLLLLGATMHEHLVAYVGGVVHGDHDLLGRSVWEPSFEVDGRALEGIDLQRVHAELIPDWFITLAHLDPDSARVRRAYDALRSGVSADSRLEAIVVEAHGLIVEDPWAHGERLLVLTAAWTDYLEEQGLPWHLEGNVVDLGDEPFFYTKSYFVDANLQVPLGRESIPLRVLRRADHTNVREGYLGMVVEGQDRALVVVDRVREHAIDDLWPLLDPDGEERLAERERAFAPYVRRGLVDAVEPPLVEVLQRTAHARWELMMAAEAINLRQACGSRFVINRVPWQGFDKGTLDDLERVAEASGSEPCPSVTVGEADRILRATRALRNEEELEPALEALVAWVARGTAVHELRHVADHRVVGNSEEPPPCSGCEELNRQAVVELSAYLASFAWSDARHAALFQACTQTAGSHAWAVAWFSDHAGGLCDAPAEDLGLQAATLERELFGERARVELPAEWPARLPVR